MTDYDEPLGALLDEYLANLLISGNKRKSAQSAGLTYAQVKAYCEANEDFAEREKEALLTRSARIVETLEEQALHGIREYLFDKQGKQIFAVDENGRQVPAYRIKQLETPLRVAMLKRHDPAYREDRGIDEKKGVVKTGVLVMPKEMTEEEFAKYVAEQSRE